MLRLFGGSRLAPTTEPGSVVGALSQIGALNPPTGCEIWGDLRVEPDGAELLVIDRLSGGSGASKAKRGTSSDDRVERPRSWARLRIRRIERAALGLPSGGSTTAKPQRCAGLRADAAEHPAKSGAAFGQHGCSEPPKPDALAASFGSRQADRSPATGESVATPAPQLRLGSIGLTASRRSSRPFTTVRVFATSTEKGPRDSFAALFLP